MRAPHDLWVFGYGSLMWRPGFAYEEARHARLTGYRRCFCIYSVHHRGTAKRPGMVLGLDRGGACEGIAYRVAAANVAETVRYLRAREQVNGVYREAHVPVELIEGPRREVLALAYIVERAHPSYAGRLPLALQARLIRGGRGLSGNNLDYLISTLRHLERARHPRARAGAAAGGDRAAHGQVRDGGACEPLRGGAVAGRLAEPPAVRRKLRTAELRRFLHRLRLG